MHNAMPLQCRPPDQDLIKESDDITHCAGIETDVTLATPAVLERERERDGEHAWPKPKATTLLPPPGRAPANNLVVDATRAVAADVSMPRNAACTAAGSEETIIAARPTEHATTRILS